MERVIGSRALGLLLLLLASSALPAPAAAQTGDWRLDVALPRFGGGFVLRSRGGDAFAEGDVELRLVHASGHGLSLRGGIGLGSTDFYPMLEGDYLFRTQLLGRPRFGLVLDVMAGVSGGDASDCVGGFACNDRPAIDGARLGTNVGASLALEVYGFFIDLDVRYRVLLPVEAGLPGDVWEPEQVFSVSAGIGFRFD